ncbi:zinc finger protein 775-like [Toxorhynchites rutilus septentrionalis]|uniref:zinc finger protein 775-like n=1 Tax=Toxorhynchites rutilus septentrionalis TaxID=329112 RepID=UPI0024798FDB|nr:zinc finger protein 775-like [Toxorhynchites rutilus septentrionalis]
MFQNGVHLLEQLELPSEATLFCRLCLAKNNLIELVPDENGSIEDDPAEASCKQRASQFVELIFECTNVRLSLENEPGCAICQHCQRALAEIYRFRFQAKRVDELIKSKLIESTTTDGRLVDAAIEIGETKQVEPCTKNAGTDGGFGKKQPSAQKRPNLAPLVPRIGVGGCTGMHKCRYCPKSFKTTGALKEHSRAHSRPHRCPNCLEQFQHGPSLARHIRNRTCFTFTKYRCRVCSESFPEQDHWVEHIKIHAEDFPYQCQECLSQFKHKATLRRHVNTVHLLQY